MSAQAGFRHLTSVFKVKSYLYISQFSMQWELFDFNKFNNVSVFKSMHPPLLSGCLLAVVAGTLYGFSFAPILYIKSQSSTPDSVFYGASDYGTFPVSTDLAFHSFRKPRYRCIFLDLTCPLSF